MFDIASPDRHNACGAKGVLSAAARVPPDAGASRSEHATGANMSAPSYGMRPPIHDDPTQATGVAVASRLIRLDPGLFSLSLMPGPADRATGLPAVRLSLPPGPPGRREAVSISAFRSDGWNGMTDEPPLLRVLPGGAEVLVTLYWNVNDGSASPPPLRLTRLNPEGVIPGSGDTVGGAPSGIPSGAPSGGIARETIPGLSGASTPSRAEVVAHIEGIGDVDSKAGDWVGMRGSGRAIEGFSLTPRQGITPDEFEIRAVLGRDWLSPWLPGGSFCGSRGLALPLRGFCLRLHPAAAARADLACFARFVDGSEVGPVGSDRVIAAPSLAALEAFQVVMRPRIG
jgi:hypothetical protein